MTTPTEKPCAVHVWTYRNDKRSVYGEFVRIEEYRELYDYAVRLESENKALSVHAENLEIVRKQRDEAQKWSAIAWGELAQAIRERDEAQDIVRKLLAYIRIESEPDIGDLGMYTQTRRERWYKRKTALLATFPEWLRRELAGMDDEDCLDCICGHGADRHNNAAHCSDCECKAYEEA